MKKTIIMTVAIAMVMGAQAKLINWYSDDFSGDSIGATLQAGWLVAVYQDSNHDNNSDSGWYDQLRMDKDGLSTSSGVTAEDALLGFTDQILNAGAIYFAGLWSQNATDNSDLYTVIFNSSTIGGADSFIVVDSSTFNVGTAGVPDSPVDYMVGPTINGSWQTKAIPEPAVASFIAIFGGGMLFARRIFKRA